MRKINKTSKRLITFTEKEFEDFIWVNCRKIGSFHGTFYKMSSYKTWFKKVKKEGFKVKFD